MAAAPVLKARVAKQNSNRQRAVAATAKVHSRILLGLDVTTQFVSAVPPLQGRQLGCFCAGNRHNGDFCLVMQQSAFRGSIM